MRKIATTKQNNMNNNGVDDHGKMGWVGENTNRKSFITALPKYLGIEWLEKEHKRSDWWRTLGLDKKWLSTWWLTINTAATQLKGTNDVESPIIAENKWTIE